MQKKKNYFQEIKNFFKPKINFSKKNKTIFVVSFICLVILLITSMLFLTLYKLQKTLITSSNITTTNNNLKTLLELKITDIEKNNSVLFPYNKNQMSIIKKTLAIIDSTDLLKLFTIAQNIPNNNFGYDPIIKLYNPINTTCFQFNRGCIGWYWCYGTKLKYLPNNKVNYYSFIFYIIRNDLVPKYILNKLGYKLGEATLYSVSAGIGMNNTWYYNPLTIVKATNICNSNGQKLTWAVTNSFSLSKSGQVKINYTFKNQFDTECILQNIELNKTMPAYFNGNKNGQFPYFGGAGTNYWSYPGLKINNSSNLGFPSSVLGGHKLGADTSNNPQLVNIAGGIGWLDHQWINLYPKQKLAQLLSTVFNKKHDLGRYIWLNLHPSSGELKGNHYMIYCFPDININMNYLDVNSPITFNAKYNKYNANTSSLNNDCTITIVELHKPLIQRNYTNNSILGKVIYPKKYFINIENKNLVLDSSNFGLSYTIDLTGNYHYSGAAILSINTPAATYSTIIGTGFMEANHFQTNELYKKTTLSIIKLDNNYNIFNQSTGNKFISFFTIISLILISIGILVLISIFIIFLFQK